MQRVTYIPIILRTLSTFAKNLHVLVPPFIMEMAMDDYSSNIVEQIIDVEPHVVHTYSHSCTIFSTPYISYDAH